MPNLFRHLLTGQACFSILIKPSKNKIPKQIRDDELIGWLFNKKYANIKEVVMETWLVICLVLAAVGIFVTRNYPKIEGLMLGLFAGLMMALMILNYPSMPFKAATTFESAGRLVVFFPVSVFFLAYFYRLPMDFFTLLGSATTFTLAYGTILQVVFSKSAETTTFLDLTVFFAVFLAMYGFSWAIRGWRYVAAALSTSANNNVEQGIAGTDGYKQI
ncbi:hypothetical protein KKF25_01965 [Patescibacteria group bacterium]|nr:hypothetical protein [Patescibacteria group bacterium]